MYINHSCLAFFNLSVNNTPARDKDPTGILLGPNQLVVRSCDSHISSVLNKISNGQPRPEINCVNALIKHNLSYT